MPPGPYRELLAGNGEPEELSDDLKQLCICDTGCGTSMPNRPGQCRRKSIYNSDSLIEGAGGQLTIKQKGYLSIEHQTMLKKKFNIKFGEVDPDEDYFLGANRAVNKARDVVIVRATT